MSCEVVQRDTRLTLGGTRKKRTNAGENAAVGGGASRPRVAALLLPDGHPTSTKLQNRPAPPGAATSHRRRDYSDDAQEHLLILLDNIACCLEAKMGGQSLPGVSPLVWRLGISAATARSIELIADFVESEGARCVWREFFKPRCRDCS